MRVPTITLISSRGAVRSFNAPVPSDEVTAERILRSIEDGAVNVHHMVTSTRVSSVIEMLVILARKRDLRVTIVTPEGAMVDSESLMATLF